MLTHGVPLKVVSELLGHSSIANHRRRLRARRTRRLARAVDILGDALGI
jgi:site-specific recombinase XerD